MTADHSCIFCSDQRKSHHGSRAAAGGTVEIAAHQPGVAVASCSAAVLAAGAACSVACVAAFGVAAAVAANSPVAVACPAAAWPAVAYPVVACRAVA